MSKRAEEAAIKVYPLKDYTKEPNYIHTCDTKMLDEVYRDVFRIGYELAEKNAIERVIGWVKKNAYIYTDIQNDEEGNLMTVFLEGAFIDDLTKAMEEE